VWLVHPSVLGREKENEWGNCINKQSYFENFSRCAFSLFTSRLTWLNIYRALLQHFIKGLGLLHDVSYRKRDGGRKCR
jgi:hypothetical protein